MTDDFQSALTETLSAVQVERERLRVTVEAAEQNLRAFDDAIAAAAAEFRAALPQAEPTEQPAEA